MRYITILLLLTGTLSAQTKWRQIERSLTKWNVPAAYDSIPGQTGYASKYISLLALLDSLGGVGGGIKGTGTAGRVAFWAASDSLTSHPNFKWTSNNYLDITGRIGLQVTSTAGNWNVFFNGGNTTLTGIRNVGLGSNQTLSSLTTGSDNFAFGTAAGSKTTTGSGNVYLGYLSGQENVTGDNNMFIGSQAGYLTTGQANVFIGSQAGGNTTNTTGSTYIGTLAGTQASNSSNVGIGFYNSNNTSNSGESNTVIGSFASQNGGGSKSVKIGTSSGYGNTGSNNVFIGQESGYATSSKGGNIFIGYQSGRNEDIDNSLIIANSTATNNGIYGDFDTNKFGVNVAPGSLTRTFDINGELRVRDLTTDSPTLLMGADSDGDVASITVGNGLTLASSTLRADTSIVATQYDLTLLDPSITNEIQTIDTFQIYDTNKLRISLSNDNQPAMFVTLPSGGGIDSTVVLSGWGINVVETPLNTFNVKADSSEVASQYDLTLKQDKLVSGTNIKTVNSNSLLGTGNVSVGTVTSVGTSAPITGGTITGSGTIGLSYDATYMGLNGSNQLYPLFNVATWNANQLRGSNISVPFSPTTGQVLTYNGSAWSPATPSASATNLTFTGSSSPFTLNSDTGTDVTFAAGTGIALSRSSNQLTIESTLTAAQTWGDFTTNIQSWGSTGSFGSGKDVGIGGQPSRDFDVIGDSRLRGAIYNSSNSAGTTGQVLTSQGASAWTWATPADNSATNEAQTLTLGTNQTIALSSVAGVGGGSFEIPQYRHASMWKTSNLSGQTLDATARKLTFDSQVSAPGLAANTTNGLITPNVSGIYRIDYSGSYSVNATYDQSVLFELYKGAVTFGYQSECRTRVSDATVNNMTNFSKTIVTTLNANEAISLYYTKSVGTNATITFYNLNFSIQRIN
jgi:hypothetical protein